MIISIASSDIAQYQTGSCWGFIKCLHIFTNLTTVSFSIKIKITCSILSLIRWDKTLHGWFVKRLDRFNRSNTEIGGHRIGRWDNSEYREISDCECLEVSLCVEGESIICDWEFTWYICKLKRTNQSVGQCQRSCMCHYGCQELVTVCLLPFISNAFFGRRKTTTYSIR
jgi:hypothetical protein